MSCGDARDALQAEGTVFQTDRTAFWVPLGKSGDARTKQGLSRAGGGGGWAR